MGFTLSFCAITLWAGVHLILMNKIITFFACCLFLLFHPIDRVIAQDNSIIGEWTGHWTYNKWDPDSDAVSLASGRTVVRIEKSGDSYSVRIKEVEDSANPPITRYINGITINNATLSSIELEFPDPNWDTTHYRKLVLMEGYISMTATAYIHDINRSGKECPVLTAFNNYGEHPKFRELKLFKEDNNW